MNYDIKSHQFPEDQVSLHDCCITKICSTPDSIVFEFQDGVILFDGQSSATTSYRQIRLLRCTNRDIKCKLIKRKATSKGVKFSGRTISIDALNKLLTKKYSVDIFLELYDDSFLYWRCSLYNHKRSSRGLLPHIVIEANDFSSVEISGNNPENFKQENSSFSY